MFSFLDDVKITKVAAASATGTTTISSSIVDMAGYDGAVFITTLTTPNATNFAKIADGNDSGLSDAADIAGSKVTPTGAGPAVIVETVENPLRRYLQFSVNRGGATSVLGEIYCIQYRGKKLPIVNIDSATYFGKALANPTEGTA